jgi:hypothetical protein
MTRHRIDLFALLFGIAFAFAGLILFATQFTDTTPGPRWTIAFGLILLGTVTLISTVASGLRGAREAPESAPKPTPTPDDSDD